MPRRCAARLRFEQDLSDLTALAIPVIAMDRSPDASPVSNVRTDNERSARAATEHLVGHGHRVVGFIGGPDNGVSQARESGWREALADAGLAPGPTARAAFSYAGGAEACAQVFTEEAEPPSAVFIASDVQAIGALATLAGLGRSVPDDVAIVSMDGTDAAQFTVPRLTTFAQPLADLAADAVSHLIQQPSRIVHRTLSGQLLLGASCGCPIGGAPTTPIPRAPRPPE